MQLERAGAPGPKESGIPERSLSEATGQVLLKDEATGLVLRTGFAEPREGPWRETKPS